MEVDGIRNATEAHNYVSALLLMTVKRKLSCGAQRLERLYEEFCEIVARRGLPESVTLALSGAAIGLRVRNASYGVAADISNNLASRDLKALVDQELLIPAGEKRGREYTAPGLVRKVRERCRLPKGQDDLCS
jgi:hypothetical protein